MNYLQEIESIIGKLNTNGFSAEAELTQQMFRSLTNSSELLMSVTHHLLNLIRLDAAINALIGGEVLKLKKYCQAIGLNVSG